MTKSNPILVRIVWIHFLLLCVGTLFAQEASEKTGALLWKVSGNGLEHPSYIYGTHHLLPTTFLDSIAGLSEAFATCQQVIGEVDMNTMSEVAEEVQAMTAMPKDTTWQMLFSEEDYALVDSKLTEVLGVGVAQLGAVKPATVSTIYALEHYKRAFPNVDFNNNMDSWFQQQAAARAMPVVGLETVREQLVLLFASVSLTDQAQQLACVMKDTTDITTTFQKLNTHYRAADLDGLLEVSSERNECYHNPAHEYAINEGRNKKWLERLPAMMSKCPSFVAVGSLHLAGEIGLLVGLEKMGYRVVPVQ